MRFKFFVESGVDIFGFEKKSEDELGNKDHDDQPIKFFNTELMVKYLSQIPLGTSYGERPFMNEVIWGGDHHGAMRVEINPRMLFLIQRLGKDIEGNQRWITKQAFQLNRRGYGGYEESVAYEIYDHVKTIAKSGLEGPKHDFEELSSLSDYVATKLRRTAQEKFIFRGIKKISEYNYQIIFEVGGQGIEAKDHRRVEQNVTDLSYDKKCGTIRVRNFNIESKTGGAHAWKPMPCYLDCYFFPDQDRSEIADPFMILLKYY